MPGFSKKEQARLSLLTLAHRGNLKKLKGLLTNEEDCVLAMSLRLAVLLNRNRSNTIFPDMYLHFKEKKYRFTLDSAWLKNNPLTKAALQEEVNQWKNLKVGVKIIAE